MRPRVTWRLAKRLRATLLKNPAFGTLPVCPRCGRSTALADWSRREVSCRDCETAGDPMHWHDTENERPFLPEDE